MYSYRIFVPKPDTQSSAPTESRGILMTETRDLNFEAIRYMKECGFHADYILEALVNALDAYTVNDMFNFIFKKHKFANRDAEGKILSESLSKYDKQSLM